MANDNTGVRLQYDYTFIDDPIKLRLTDLVQIGEISLDSNSDVLRHSQMCSEISYIISGSGFFIHNGDICPVSAGDVIISPSTGYHYISAAKNDSLAYAYCGFNLIENSGFSDDVLHFFACENQRTVSDNAEIYGYFRKCMDEFYRGENPDKILVESYLIQIIMLTYRMAEGTEKTPVRPEQSDMGQLIYRIMKYIDRNITKPPTVGQVAESLGYSAYYISHIFKSKMGVTLQSYINDCRIKRIKELITHRNLSFTEIYSKMGYLNQQSFSRAFKHSTGMTPSEYRANLN